MKFRIWDKINKKFIYSNECIGINTEYKSIEFSIDYQKTSLDIYDIEDGYPEIIINLASGLIDKNGVEIYEGDIVNVLHYGIPVGQGLSKSDIETDEVIFNKGQFTLRYSRRLADILSYSKNVEIIGNIYENNKT